ncbi:hypothetical protein HD806DRAFT_414072 [Xylariaceae sp. AK1471]|nr:hypothetical protein HD806DRAFT_414072 [Xylariaceae sp. AK1471]
MAASWPQERAWPTEPREHAAYLSRYLRDALDCVERAGDQPVPSNIVKSMILGITSLVTKIRNMPDVRVLHEALNLVQAEARAEAQNKTQALQETKKELEDAKTKLNKSIIIAEEGKMAAREATKMGRTVTAMLKEMKTAGGQNRVASTPSYAAIASKGLATSVRNIQTAKNTNMQAQREIIVNIRDPITVTNLRAMSPRNLKAHVDRAIEQSSNEHVKKVKAVSVNQLRSGDLSIRTATAYDVESLRQFAGDWVEGLGNRASVQVPTYGILAHGIRTHTMDINKFNDIKNEILRDNRPFIPNADIKYIGWLSRKSTQKFMSTAIIEFTRPEDANKIIDEGLIWQGEVVQCERYERG